MVLETIDSQKITVGGLQIEEKSEKDSPFDPKKDLTPYDYQQMNKRLIDLKQTSSWLNFFEMARFLSRIEGKSKADIIDDVEQAARDTVIGYVSNGSTPWALKLAAVSIEIFPDKEIYNTRGFLPPYFEESANFDIRANGMSVDGRQDHFEGAASYKILYPDKSGDWQITNSNVWKEIDELINSLSKSESTISNWAKIMANIRIAYPDKYEEIASYGIPWGPMKDRLKRFCSLADEEHNNDWWEAAAELASNMLILAAKEVKVGENGLEITSSPRQILEDKKITMPEERGF